MKFKDKFLTKNQKLKNYIYGSFLILISIFFLVSFLIYNEDNISFNTVSTIKNDSFFLKSLASYIGDILVQIFEFSTFSFIFSFIILGYNIIFNKIIYKKTQKYLSLIGLFISSSILFNNFSNNKYCYEKCGGLFGNFLINYLYYLPIWMLNLLSMSIFFISISFFLDIKRRWWLIKSKIFYEYTLKIIKFLLKNIKILINLVMTKNLKDKIKKNIIIHKKNNSLNEINILNQTNHKKNNEIKITTKTINNKTYLLPNTLILNKNTESKNNVSKEELINNSNRLIKVLNEYKINGKIVDAKPGPIVTLYELEPAPGTLSSRVIGLASDIARSMSALSARISSIPGKNIIGIELPNKKRETIYIKDLLESKKFKENKFLLPIIIGLDIMGETVISDLSKLPHLLIAGTTGSGKSVAINAIITSLLYKFTPDQCKFIMIDPKMLELSVYENIPHLLTNIIIEPQKAVNALKWVCKEMDRRYITMADLGVRNIEGYNEKVQNAIINNTKLVKKNQNGFDPETGEPIYIEEEIEKKEMPYIVVIVDEMHDLMITAGKEIDVAIQRLAAKARASGIHIIMATQRPSVDVITGVIKANFPARMAFSVVNSTDSQVILGSKGAEQLLGKGDMLYMEVGGKIKRAHGPFVSDEEVEKIVNFILSQGIKPNFVNLSLSDDEDINNIDNHISIGQKDLFGENKEQELYDKALDIVFESGRCSASYIQRQLNIGFNKASTLVELMEKNGILSSPDNNGRRKLIKKNKD